MKKLSKELRGKTTNELEKQVSKTQEEIAKLSLNQVVNPTKDTNQLRKKRKELAAILTVLTEKKELEKLKK